MKIKEAGNFDFSKITDKTYNVKWVKSVRSSVTGNYYFKKEQKSLIEKQMEFIVFYPLNVTVKATINYFHATLLGVRDTPTQTHKQIVAIAANVTFPYLTNDVGANLNSNNYSMLSQFNANSAKPSLTAMFIWSYGYY